MAKAFASRNQMESALDQIQAALRGAPRDADVRHTLGTIFERMHRYDEAATAYLAYLSAIRGDDRPEQTRWARSHIAFLRSFEGSVPFEMESTRHVTRHVLDFRLVDGKVVLRGKINGGRSVDLTLDTGAEYSAISEKTAARFGVQPLTETLIAGVGEIGLRGQRLAKIRQLDLGTLRIYNLPCLIKTPSVPGLPVDTTDGFSPLALGLSMTVDYRTRRVSLGEIEADSAPARELSLRFNRLATVEGRVNGTPLSFIVDTGGEGILVSTSAARGLFTPADRYPIKLRVYGASGYEPDAYLLPGLDLSFGPLRLPNLSVVVLDLSAPSVLLGYEVGGILGYRLLGHYRVDFDLTRSVLRLRDL
jgi:predicted aspartyl protease